MPKTDLQKIPGVGPNIEKHLLALGYTSIASLQGAAPQQMFDYDCELQGCRLDRCLLYVYRLAVYYADNPVHEPEKLKWWYWKNHNYV